MIIYNPKVWFSIFQNYGKHVIRTLRPALIFMLIYSTALSFVVSYFNLHFISTLTMHQLLGIVLGLFLVFRTNTAYDRWWEGRRLWGLMVNNTRNLSFKIHAYLDPKDKEERLWFAQVISNLTVSFKDSLRGKVNVEDLDIVDQEMSSALVHAKHVPNIISSKLYNRVTGLFKAGKITGDQLITLDRELKEFSDI